MSKSSSNFISSENSYSKALYELADESKSLTQIESQALAMINLIYQSKDFNQLLGLLIIILGAILAIWFHSLYGPIGYLILLCLICQKV